MKKLLIATPAFNEQENVERHYKDIVEVTKDLRQDYDIDCLFVDDGSSDQTLEKIKSLKVENIKINCISFSKNFGKEAAILATLKFAKENNYDGLILMDIDGQDDPKVIPELVRQYENGHDLVLTRHKTRQGQTIVYKTLTKVFYGLFGLLTGQRQMTRGLRDYCLMSREVIDGLLQYKDKRRFFKGLIQNIGFKKTVIEFDYVERKEGKTKWNYKKLFKYALTSFLEFSNLYKNISWIFLFISLALFVGNVTLIHVNLSIELLQKILFVELGGLISLFTVSNLFILSLLYEMKEITLDKPLYIVREKYEKQN